MCICLGVGVVSPRLHGIYPKPGHQVQKNQGLDSPIVAFWRNRAAAPLFPGLRPGPILPPELPFAGKDAMPTGLREIIAVLGLLAGCALCPGPARADRRARGRGAWARGANCVGRGAWRTHNTLEDARQVTHVKHIMEFRWCRHKVLLRPDPQFDRCRNSFASCITNRLLFLCHFHRL